MPGRLHQQARAPAQPNDIRTKRKRVQERALNALALADDEEPHPQRTRRHRLGELDASGQNKRRRTNEATEVPDEDISSNARQAQQQNFRHRYYDEGSSRGSDSEGNEWRLGHVDHDEDSDLDSDEAFAESDEERFEGFAFRGSAKSKAQRSLQLRKQKLKITDGASQKDLEDRLGHSDDDDDLGEDAVDLAAMLNDYAGDLEANLSDADTESADDSTQESHMEKDDPQSLSELKDFVSKLPEDVSASDGHQRSAQGSLSHPEKKAPKAKLTLEDMLGAAGKDTATFKKSRKLMDTAKGQPKSTGVPGKLEAPLPRRQKDRIERIAADREAKKTLDRWVDTVKDHRRTDHISFPLLDSDAIREGPRRLRPVSGIPETELEDVVKGIMKESGIAPADLYDAEEQMQEIEELQMTRLPLEEVQRRRAELRMQRDLMFREEIRAKRLKKIKSKAYRRIHRKERNRVELKENAAFGGSEVSDDERERVDRRRAEERMGARHRDSKWAKGIKQTGRATWDADARAGVEDMARRNDELRARIQGKAVNDVESDATSDWSEGENELSDAVNHGSAGLQPSLDSGDDASATMTGIASMKFMRKAEDAKKAQNDLDTKTLRRELAGGNPFPSDDSEQEREEFQGRRKYGPHANVASTASKIKATDASEFEERLSDTEVRGAISVTNTEAAQSSSRLTRNKRRGFPDASLKGLQSISSETQPAKADLSSEVVGASVRGPQLSRPMRALSSSAEARSAADANGWLTVFNNIDDDINEVSPVSRDQEDDLTLQERLLQQAFGGDNTVEAFSKEKVETVEEEDEKLIDNAVPGWGSWTGAGVSKREQNRNKGKSLSKTQGTRPQNRRDAKLDNVIINEKSSKKNGAFLASALPFPYTNRDEYERSMRMPIGGEWNTKVTVQKNVKPRVLIKPGRVIAPIEKPLA